MSYFGTALKGLLDRKNMKAIRLAEVSGVGRALISRYMSGEQEWVSPEHLNSLARAVSDDPREQAELLLARLLDERKGAGSDLIEISIRDKNSRTQEAPPSYRIPLPKDAEADFETIREFYMKDANVRDLVQGLANLLRSGDVRTPSELVEHRPAPTQRRRSAGLSPSQQQ